MCYGPAGAGKTSFIELFLKKFDYKKSKGILKQHKTNQPFSKYNTGPIKPPTEEIDDTYIVEKRTKDNKKVILTLIDTPGYGRTLDLESQSDEIIQYLKHKMLDYYKKEKFILHRHKEDIQIQ